MEIPKKGRLVWLAKRLGAFLILLSLSLPMSSCTTEIKPGDSPDALPIITKVPKTYRYVWSSNRKTDPMQYLIVFAFVWPAVSLLRRPPISRLPLKILGTSLELLHAAATGYIIYVLGLFLGEPETGFFVAATGWVLFVPARGTEIVADYRALWRQRKTAAGGPVPAAASDN